MKIILDTNFLMIPGTLKIDVFTQIKEEIPDPKLYVVDESVNELIKISQDKRQKQKHREAAKLALQFINKFNIRVVSSKTTSFKNVDELILKIAKRGGFAVATQDQAFKRILKENNVQILILRQKKHVKLI
ncbi:hypothetical protein KY325_03490 [Candidatus Woesearchaeota archaeon]|nr:hypothetical protein [Candidatus Woesearchaeota archaeon]MBW3018196.1 hypothetical protein [Candidatus Woesearchaeota archaeon]